MKRRMAASLYLACAALTTVLASILARESVVEQEQAVRAFAQHWGPRFPELQVIIKPRMAHLADLVPLYGITLSVLVLQVVSTWAIWKSDKLVSTVTLPIATLLALISVQALYMAGNPINTCFGEDGCGVALANAQTLLRAAKLAAIGGVLICPLMLFVRVQWLR